VATGAAESAAVAMPASKRVEVTLGARSEFALVDAALCREPFVGARALWDPARVVALVLARAEPWALGLSSIGGRVHPLGPDCPHGLLVELGDGGVRITVPLAPGMVCDVPVRAWRPLELGEEVVLPVSSGTVALDGERELVAAPRGDHALRARVTANGPRLVDVRAVLAAAAGCTTSAAKVASPA
jgi:hypothetical protein